MFIIGLLLFAAASLLGCVAPTAWLLVAARAVQGGMVAALLMPGLLQESRRGTTHAQLDVLGAAAATAGLGLFVCMA
jgi:MFS family permease